MYKCIRVQVNLGVSLAGVVESVPVSDAQSYRTLEAHCYVNYGARNSYILALQSVSPVRPTGAVSSHSTPLWSCSTVHLSHVTASVVRNSIVGANFTNFQF